MSAPSLSRRPQYRIQLRDSNLVPLAELTDFLDGDVVLNFNDVGAWVVTVRATTGAYLIKNLLSANQSDIEASTTGFSTAPGFLIQFAGATITRDTTQFWHGASSLKVVCDGLHANEGEETSPNSLSAPATTPITASRYVSAAVGVQIRCGLRDYTNGVSAPDVFVTGTGVGNWIRVSNTFTTGANPVTDLRMSTNCGGTAVASTWYVDGQQLEVGSVATVWTLGGATVLAGQSASVTTPLDAYFAAGNGIIISRDRGDGSGAQTLLSGPIWHLERRLQDNVYVLAGPSDDWWLKARRADPGTSPYATVAYDTRTATASTAIRGYVDTNAGPSAPVARRVTGLTLAADPLIGTSVTGNARFDNLLALIQQLAVSGGDIGFRLVQTDVGTLTFTIYQPATQSNAIFSRELGNLLDATYTLDGPAANAYVGAGSGDLTARVFTSGQDATSIATWGLVEGFLDARDTADVPTIGQRITAQLATDAQKTNLTITPVDTAALQFGRDYGLGDIVSVQIDGATITDKIRQLHIQLDGSNQELVSPGIGNAGAGQIAQLFDARTRALANVAQQVARLQAAK